MLKVDTYTDMFIDTVCWVKVPSYRKNFRASHLMRTYYFCSESCRKTFESDPNKYVGLSAPWHKGALKLYLRRLTRTESIYKD